MPRSHDLVKQGDKAKQGLVSDDCSELLSPFLSCRVISHIMMVSHTPHRTPLRRISQGSLFALSRSEQNPDAPHGLGFLEPVMSELVDEAEALQANVEGLRSLSQSLKTFNECFASLLYVMDMNALTTDWPQVCWICEDTPGALTVMTRLQLMRLSD